MQFLLHDVALIEHHDEVRAREQAVRADLGEHLERMLDAVGERLFEDILGDGVSTYSLDEFVIVSGKSTVTVTVSVQPVTSTVKPQLTSSKAAIDIANTTVFDAFDRPSAREGGSA